MNLYCLRAQAKFISQGERPGCWMLRWAEWGTSVLRRGTDRGIAALAIYYYISAVQVYCVSSWWSTVPPFTWRPMLNPGSERLDERDLSNWWGHSLFKLSQDYIGFSGYCSNCANRKTILILLPAQYSIRKHQQTSPIKHNTSTSWLSY